MLLFSYKNYASLFTIAITSIFIILLPRKSVYKPSMFSIFSGRCGILVDKFTFMFLRVKRINKSMGIESGF